MTSPRHDYFWPLAGRGPLLVLVGLIAGLLVVFNLVPQADIAASRFFFEPQPCAGGTGVCGVFPLAENAGVQQFRQALQVVPVALAILLLVVILARLVFRRSLADPFDRAGLAAVGALVLGAGAAVNGVLKEQWGRPRPAFTDLFGGPHPFVPAGHISDHCASNCSFVSGEAASSFWLIGLATLAPARFRILALVAATAVACATALLRVGFGGHYLSDVLIGGLLSLLIFSLIATAIRPFLRGGARPA